MNQKPDDSPLNWFPYVLKGTIVLELTEIRDKQADKLLYIMNKLLSLNFLFIKDSLHLCHLHKKHTYS